MPSYRVVMTLGRVHPGADGQAVLPRAADAVERLAVVEARSVGVAKGRGQATVRFEATDDDTARPVAAAAAAAAGSQAEILEVQLRRQAGTRWALVR
ncbi:MAG TPA: hypothetical protein VGO26_02140 [Amnibacterium sp.]|jgi:hypothetical protein|nr:hypothetical protein [Amnibacterium sp.]